MSQCKAIDGQFVRLKAIDTGQDSSREVVFTDPTKPYQEVKVGEIQNKCIARWDDSHQVHSVRTIVRWNYQAVKTRMKKLEHCVRIQVTGPVDIQDVAKAYVDQCATMA